MDRKRRRLRERVAATCPLGDHRSTEHRVLFRPTSIGLRSGTRSLALFVEPVSLPRAHRHSLSLPLPRVPRISPFFPLSLAAWKGRRMRRGRSREYPRVYARGGMRGGVHISFVRAEKLEGRKKKQRSRYTISRFLDKFISRLFLPDGRYAPCSADKLRRISSERE